MSDDKMKREIHRAYGRGYNAGSKKAWPHHRPPEPPNEIIRSMMNAARELRDEVDYYLSWLMPDDELNTTLGPKIDDLDEAFRRVTEWLRKLEVDHA